MANKRINYERIYQATEQFVEDIDLPEELYRDFFLGLLLLIGSMSRPVKAQKRKKKHKDNVVKFQR